METKEQMEILDNMFLPTICNIPSHCRLAFSLMQRGQLNSPTISCNRFQCDLEGTTIPTACQKLFHSFFGDSLSTLLTPVTGGICIPVPPPGVVLTQLPEHLLYWVKIKNCFPGNTTRKIKIFHPDQLSATTCETTAKPVVLEKAEKIMLISE